MRFWLCLLSVLFSSSALAVELEVLVLYPGGSPAENALVVFEPDIPGKKKRAVFTNEQGIARSDVDLGMYMIRVDTGRSRELRRVDNSIEGAVELPEGNAFYRVIEKQVLVADEVGQSGSVTRVELSLVPYPKVVTLEPYSERAPDSGIPFELYPAEFILIDNEEQPRLVIADAQSQSGNLVVQFGVDELRGVVNLQLRDQNPNSAFLPTKASIQLVPLVDRYPLRVSFVNSRAKIKFWRNGVEWSLPDNMEFRVRCKGASVATRDVEVSTTVSPDDINPTISLRSGSYDCTAHSNWPNVYASRRVEQVFLPRDNNELKFEVFNPSVNTRFLARDMLSRKPVFGLTNKIVVRTSDEMLETDGVPAVFDQGLFSDVLFNQSEPFSSLFDSSSLPQNSSVSLAMIPLIPGQEYRYSVQASENSLRMGRIVGRGGDQQAPEQSGGNGALEGNSGGSNGESPSSALTVEAEDFQAEVAAAQFIPGGQGGSSSGGQGASQQDYYIFVQSTGTFQLEEGGTNNNIALDVLRLNASVRYELSHPSADQSELEDNVLVRASMNLGGDRPPIVIEEPYDSNKPLLVPAGVQIDLSFSLERSLNFISPPVISLDPLAVIEERSVVLDLVSPSEDLIVWAQGRQEQASITCTANFQNGSSVVRTERNSPNIKIPVPNFFENPSLSRFIILACASYREGDDSFYRSLQPLLLDEQGPQEIELSELAALPYIKRHNFAFFCDDDFELERGSRLDLKAGAVSENKGVCSMSVESATELAITPFFFPLGRALDYSFYDEVGFKVQPIAKLTKSAVSESLEVFGVSFDGLDLNFGHVEKGSGTAKIAQQTERYNDELKVVTSDFSAWEAYLEFYDLFAGQLPSAVACLASLNPTGGMTAVLSWLRPALDPDANLLVRVLGRNVRLSSSVDPDGNGSGGSQGGGGSGGGEDPPADGPDSGDDGASSEDNSNEGGNSSDDSGNEQLQDEPPLTPESIRNALRELKKSFKKTRKRMARLRAQLKRLRAAKASRRRMRRAKARLAQSKRGLKDMRAERSRLTSLASASGIAAASIQLYSFPVGSEESLSIEADGEVIEFQVLPEFLSEGPFVTCSAN